MMRRSNISVWIHHKSLVYLYILLSVMALPLVFGMHWITGKHGRGLDYIKLGEVRLHTSLNMFIIN